MGNSDVNLRLQLQISWSSVLYCWDTVLRASGAEADVRRMFSVVVFFIFVLIVRPILRESSQLQSR